MAQFYDHITDKQAAWIGRQKIFFTATAPHLDADGVNQGHINLSPKGMDSFRVLGPNRVAYLDLTGSGNETSAHLRQNGRITIMFCAFEGPPMIVRLFGRGYVVTQDDPAWPALAAHFPEYPGTRQIMVIDVDQSQDSCGMSVPLYTFEKHRDTLVKEWDKRGPEEVRNYWGRKNTTSIDGLKPFPLKS